ncbi:TPA: winged helix-turn-helix domain-containing protein [Methanosarcinaceae archaeon]|nr:winged helix-turn-helix domain-containing protein [Methanosarcinaceae archaeon]
MKKKLLELIFLSEKRKNLLLFLKEGPKTIEDIRSALDVSSVAILPQIKKLRERNLVLKDGNIYRLSPLGRSIVGRMKDMVGVLGVFGNNYNYWSRHAIECIPLHLLKRIDELGECTFSEPPDRTHLFEPHREFVENIAQSSYLWGTASIFHPLYPALFLNFAKSGMKVSILVTDSVFDRIREEYRAELSAFIDMETSHFYVCRENLELSHVVTDRFFSLSLPFHDGTFDHKEDVLCFGPSALNWGKELFAYYRDRSEEITEI